MWSPLVLGFIAATYLGVCQICMADGTRELLSDQGLYSGDTDQTNSVRMDIYTWADSRVEVDGLAEGGPATPEGRQILTVKVNRNWGGCGLFHVAMDDTSIVKEYDYSAYENGAVRFWLRSDSSLVCEIEFVSATGVIQKVGATIPSTANEWKEVVLPLSSFGPELNLKRIRGPFLITATSGIGPKNWAVDHVRWTKPFSKLAFLPENANVTAGSHLQLTIVGRTEAGEAVLVYPIMTVSGTMGVIPPALPNSRQSFVFTAGPATGDVTIIATADASTRSAVQSTNVVHIVSPQRYSQLGLISETVQPSIQLDKESKLLAFSGGSADKVLIESTIDDFTEGEKSIRTTVSNPGQDAVSGWTIQWGLEDSTDRETTDMSSYYDGNLRFMIKAPAALRGKLFVGIRSAYITPGKEISRVSLSDYAALDGQWNQVRIPLKVFAKARPWSDLSRTKNLFTVSVIGNTGGAQAFLIDDLFWETNPFRLTVVGYSTADNSFKFSLLGPAGLPFSVETSSNLSQWAQMLAGTLDEAPIDYVHKKPSNSPNLFFRARSGE